MKKERTYRSLYTLIITVLLLINSIPMNLFAEENENTGNTEAVVETMEGNKTTEENNEIVEEIEAVTGDASYTASYTAKLIPVVKEDDTPVDDDPIVPETPKAPQEVRTEEPKPVTEIEEVPAPLAENEEAEVVSYEIAEEAVPQAAVKSWALINLIATLTAILTALGMIITLFTKKNEEEDEEENENVNEREDEEEEEQRRSSKFLGVIPAVLAVIIFILTEDMRNPMILTDRYTIYMVIIALLDLLLAFLTRNKKKEDEEEEREYDTAIA